MIAPSKPKFESSSQTRPKKEPSMIAHAERRPATLRLVGNEVPDIMPGDYITSLPRAMREVPAFCQNHTRGHREVVPDDELTLAEIAALKVELVAFEAGVNLAILRRRAELDTLRVRLVAGAVPVIEEAARPTERTNVVNMHSKPATENQSSGGTRQ